MPTNFDFYKGTPQPVDFSLQFQGAKLKAEADAAFGQSIARGVQHFADLQEKKRQFNVEAATKNAMLMAEQKKYEAQGLHWKAMEEQSRDTNARLNADSQFKLDAPNRAHKEAQVLAKTYADMGMPNIGDNAAGLSPQAVNEAMRNYTAQQGQAQRVQDAQDKKQKFDSAVEHANGIFDKAHDKGTLNDRERAAFGVMAQKDPNGAMARFMSYSQKKADTAQEEGFRSDVVKRTNKIANELEASGDHEKGRELRAGAAALDTYHGNDLQQKLLELDQHAQGYQIKEPKTSTSTKGPEIVLQSGKKIPDSTGLTKGGTQEELQADPKKLAALQQVAMEEAQQDPSFPAKGVEAGIRALPEKGDNSMSPEEKQKALGAINNHRQDLILKHMETIKQKYGWTRGADTAASILNDKTSSKEERVRRAKALGYNSFDELQAAAKKK